MSKLHPLLYPNLDVALIALIASSNKSILAFLIESVSPPTYNLKVLLVKNDKCSLNCAISNSPVEGNFNFLFNSTVVSFILATCNSDPAPCGFSKIV